MHKRATESKNNDDRIQFLKWTPSTIGLNLEATISVESCHRILCRVLIIGATTKTSQHEAICSDQWSQLKFNSLLNIELSGNHAQQASNFEHQKKKRGKVDVNKMRIKIQVAELLFSSSSDIHISNYYCFSKCAIFELIMSPGKLSLFVRAISDHDNQTFIVLSRDSEIGDMKLLKLNYQDYMEQHVTRADHCSMATCCW